MTIFWIDPRDNSIIKATGDDGVPPSADAIAVKVPPAPAPESGKQKWDGKQWSPPPPPPVLSLNAEELYNMLEAKGVLAEVDRPRPKR